MRATLPVVLLLAACDAPTDGADAPTCATGDDHAVVISEITFSRSEDGVSDGFDLDGDASTSGGSGGCGVQDDLAPDGTPGVDNAFARLLPILELTEASAAEQIIQDAVNSGQVLLVTRFTGVDDLVDDACVGVELLQAEGTPAVGAAGRLVADQTFERDTERPTTTLADLALTGGTVEGGPFTLTLPVSVLNANLVIEVLDARLRVTFDEDGGFEGILGGGIDVSQLLADVTSQGVSREVLALVTPVLSGLVDLAPDETGTCTRLSVTLKVKGERAFVYDGDDVAP